MGRLDYGATIPKSINLLEMKFILEYLGVAAKPSQIVAFLTEDETDARGLKEVFITLGKRLDKYRDKSDTKSYQRK